MISDKILLLKIIDSNGSISLLRKRGLSYSQISMMIKEEDNNNVVIEEEKISLTDDGRKLLEDNFSKLEIKKKEQWIIPQEHLYKKPISVNEIVLPSNKNVASYKQH